MYLFGALSCKLHDFHPKNWYVIDENIEVGYEIEIIGRISWLNNYIRKEKVVFDK